MGSGGWFLPQLLCNLGLSYLMCMNILLVYICECLARVSGALEEGIWFLGTGVTEG